jgi:hypothetical protein
VLLPAGSADCAPRFWAPRSPRGRTVLASPVRIRWLRGDPRRAARVRTSDIVAEDLQRIIAMLHSVLPTMDTASDGWRRYVTFILNAMSTAEPRQAAPSEPDRLYASTRYVADVNESG